MTPEKSSLLSPGNRVTERLTLLFYIYIIYFPLDTLHTIRHIPEIATPPEPSYSLELAGSRQAKVFSKAMKVLLPSKALSKKLPPAPATSDVHFQNLHRPTSPFRSCLNTITPLTSEEGKGGLFLTPRLCTCHYPSEQKGALHKMLATQA